MPALKLKDKDGNWIPLPTIKGADGKDGTDGKSAYQQAVDAGYTGTEAAFYAALTNIETAKTTADGAVTRLNSVDKSISTLKEITSTHNSNISKINNDASYANKVIKLDCEALLSNALNSTSYAYLKNNVLYLSVSIQGVDAMPAFTNLFKIRIGGTGLSTTSLLTYIYTTVTFGKDPNRGVMSSKIRVDYSIVNDNLVLTFVGGADGIALPAHSSQHIETAFLLPKAVYTEPSVEDIDGDVDVNPF